MTILIHFERSDACAEAHNLPEGRATTLAFDTREGAWVQFTYNTLRTQDGAEIAVMDDGGDWHYGGRPYSDIIIEFTEV